MLCSYSGDGIQLLLLGAILCPVRRIANETTVIVPIGLLFSSIVFALEIRFALEQGFLPITLLFAFVFGLRLSLFPIFSIWAEVHQTVSSGHGSRDIAKSLPSQFKLGLNLQPSHEIIHRVCL